MTRKLLPATLCHREDFVGLCSKDSDGLLDDPEFRDYLLFIRGSPIIQALSFVPATPAPYENICAKFRTTDKKFLPDYIGAITGKKGSVKLEDRAIPTVDLEATIRYIEATATTEVPPVFNTMITKEDYPKFRSVLPRIADQRILNYLDILYCAHPSEASSQRPEKVISLHMSSEDLSDLNKLRVEARVYKKEMPEKLVNFVESIVRGLATIYNLEEVEMLSEGNLKVYDRK